MKSSCLECKIPLIGRSDKKFCDDACRNSYNNKLNRDYKNLVRNTNNILRKNYRVLEQLNPDKKSKTTKYKLVELGFNFNFFTSLYTTKAGTIYYFIYDQGYLPLENDYLALVRRD